MHISLNSFRADYYKKVCLNWSTQKSEKKVIEAHRLNIQRSKLHNTVNVIRSVNCCKLSVWVNF